MTDTMSVIMPDGTQLDGIPIGTPKAAIMAKYQGYAAQPNGAPPTAFQSFLNNPVSRLARDAVIDPAMSLGSYGAQGLASIASLGGTAPNPISGNISTLQRGIQGAQGSVDTAFNNAARAGQNTPGYAAARQAVQAPSQYASSLGAVAPLVPGGAGTLGYFAQGARNLYNQATGQPVTTTAADMGNAAADATKQNLDQYTRQHPGTMLAATLAPAAVSMGSAALPELARYGSLVRGNMSIDAIKEQAAQLRAQASNAYKTADQSGMLITPQAMQDLAKNIKTKLANANVRPQLHPDTLDAYNAVQEAADTGLPHTFASLNGLHDVATQAVGASDARDAGKAYIVRNAIDDFVNNLGPQHTVAGATDPNAIAALNNARQLWAKSAQATTITNLLDKADLASSLYTGSGYENAIRNKFRAFASNPNNMKGLPQGVQDAIITTVKGGPADNALRAIGRFAVRGPVSGGAALGAGMATGLGPFMGPLAAAVPGELARMGSTALTLNNATRAARIALAGGKAANLPTLSLPQVNVMGRSLLEPHNLGLLGATGLNLLQPQAQ